jgi:GNAT superfamily N-acetyltransferase
VFNQQKETHACVSFVFVDAFRKKRSGLISCANTEEVLFVCEGEKEVGFALFFHNFSTFLGRAGIYLEDLFVLPEYRGKGYGKALLKKLAQITVERGCGRLEWACLDWNQPSIDFYRSLGAVPMDEWTTYRLTGDTLLEMAK